MTPMPEILLDTLCRFWEKVNRKTDSECWNWIGAIGSDGYGIVGINSNVYRAHRIAYYIHFKKDPNTLLVCHKCNNPPCVNPYHLFLGTQQDNMQHAFNIGRRNQNGSSNPMSKLTESDIHKIRELNQSISQARIAKLFNVTTGAINQILTGKTWSHI